MAQPSLWELPTGLPEIPSGTSGGIRKTWKHLIWRSHHLMPWRTGPLQQNKTIIGCSNKEQKTTSHHPQVLYPNPSFVMYQASYIYIYIILYYIILCYIILYYIIYIYQPVETRGRNLGISTPQGPGSDHLHTIPPKIRGLRPRTYTNLTFLTLTLGNRQLKHSVANLLIQHGVQSTNNL